MTDKMQLAAESLLPTDSQIACYTADYGPPSIEGYYDEAFSIPALIDLIRRYDNTSDAVIIACFDDTGVEAARCISSSPVIGICQAACQMATILASSFSIVTTLSRSVAALEKRVLEYGFERQCKRVRATDIPVLALEQCDNRALQKLYHQCELALDQDGSEAIVLGCAGMVELQKDLQQKYGVPVIEGVTAAVAIMDGLARLPLSTSRHSSYARPVEKTYQGSFESYSPDKC